MEINLNIIEFHLNFNKFMKYLAPLFFLLILSACGGKNENIETKAKVRPVRYGKIQPAGGSLVQTFSGTAQSSKEAQLSFKVSGTISNLAVKVGDVVSNGQVIATLDAADYNVSYEQAKANLKSAETQIKSAESQLNSSRSSYKRVERLYENNSVSLSEFEQAKSGLETAESSFQRCQGTNHRFAKTTGSRPQPSDLCPLDGPFFRCHYYGQCGGE